MTTKERTSPATGSFTIKAFPHEVKQRLRVFAAHRGQSMQEAARRLIDEGTKRSKPRKTVVEALEEIRNALEGHELELPDRDRGTRNIPAFD